MAAPLQIIALTFDWDADPRRRVLAEINQIEGRGTVRVLDAVFLVRGRMAR